MGADVRPGIEDLPPEILRMIFTYLPPRHLMGAVQLVCKLFHTMIDDDVWWITRIQSSALQVRLASCAMEDSRFEPARTYQEMTEEAERWSRWTQETPILADGHMGTVDALRLLSCGGRRMCLSAARDRSIRLWDIDRLQTSGDRRDWTVWHKQNAHGGWIWGVAQPSPDRLLSCSWDTTVKMWQMREADIEEIGSTRVGSAATSIMAVDSNVSICSTFCKRVAVLDHRDQLGMVDSYAYHRGAVFALAQDGDLLFSCGEDRRIVCTDRRNWAKPVYDTTAEDYVQSMCLRHGELVCGTHAGSLLMMRPDDLTVYKQHTVSDVHIRQVQHTRGSVMALTRERRLMVYTPGTNPILLAESREMDSEPSRFDFRHGDLAISGGEGNILFWPRPMLHE